MMNDATEYARVFQQEIKNILMNDWDPIGIQTIPEAHDEYDSYIPKIYSMLISHQSINEVFDFLFWLETEHIGLNGNRQNTLSTAEKLVDLMSRK